MDVEKLQPVLDGLQGKAEENQQDPKRAQISFGKIVGVVLDIGIEGYAMTNPRRTAKYTEWSTWCTSALQISAAPRYPTVRTTVAQN